jgi:uncharacterized protein YbaR (Trm112 family)
MKLVVTTVLWWLPPEPLLASLCYHHPVMAVNPELLKILVCPLCKAPVTVTEGGQGLKCSQCRRVYPIRDDIPVMLISEAKIED